MLVQKIHAHILEKKLILPGSTVIVGISGGPDSVFLLHILTALKDILALNLIVAHLDHGWRKDSIHDAQFCKNMAASLNITYVQGHAKELSLTKKPNGSLEEWGRLLRRHFFENVAAAYQAQAIALAHHYDDQIETFFLRLIRGAGITGLAGIKDHDGLYIRPLLEISKQEIIDYLISNNISYCIDQTNIHDTFLRNRLRRLLIPILNQCDPRFSKTFKKTHINLLQAEEFIQQTAQQALASLSTNINTLEISAFLLLHPLVQYKVLELWLCANKVLFVPSQGFFAEIIRFMKSKKNNSRRTFSRSILLKKGILLECLTE